MDKVLTAAKKAKGLCRRQIEQCYHSDGTLIRRYADRNLVWQCLDQVVDEFIQELEAK